MFLYKGEENGTPLNAYSAKISHPCLTLALIEDLHKGKKRGRYLAYILNGKREHLLEDRVFLYKNSLEPAS